MNADLQQHEQKSFLSWMRETGNMFTGEEYQFRLGIFLQNKRFVQEHNAANFGFRLALNKLAHLTPAEYKSLLGFRKIDQKFEGTKTNVVAQDAIDWRKKGACTEVKDQGQCSSCWAFSTIQAAESACFIKTGTLISFSEQNLVDCVDTCYGCNGGLMVNAFEYIVLNQGGHLMRTEDYPYTAQDETCRWDASKGVGSITGYVKIKTDSEEDLAEKISSMGPASIAIDSSNLSFQLYSSGIYDEKACSPSNINKGVGCVGYGSENGVKYWIVRNSWGPSWGEKGYIRMVKDKNNQCGEASMGIVPKT